MNYTNVYNELYKSVYVIIQAYITDYTKVYKLLCPRMRG